MGCAGHVECVKLILAASARTTQVLEASPVLHVATCIGAHASKEQAAADIGALLLTHGSDLHARCVRLLANKYGGSAGSFPSKVRPESSCPWSRCSLA